MRSTGPSRTGPAYFEARAATNLCDVRRPASAVFTAPTPMSLISSISSVYLLFYLFNGNLFSLDIMVRLFVSYLF